ncbi:MAG: hypothetical protein GQ565_06830 [Candidatus Aegiribacteria sp.]|nr:hypothetical protein [Candidatus Aegiribacteria sp.]
MKRFLLLPGSLILILNSCGGRADESQTSEFTKEDVFISDQSDESQISVLTEEDVPLCLSYDGSYYLHSTGGPTENGCEAWATLMNSGEYIYVALGPVDKLERLGLFAESTLSANDQVSENRRVPASNEYLLIDYTDFGDQAMIEELSCGADAYIIIDSDKKFIFYRVEGSIEQLDELGFPMEQLLAVNEELGSPQMIDVNTSRINVAEDRLSGELLLIGESISGVSTALGGCPTMKHWHKPHTAGYNARILSLNTSSILLKSPSILSQL